MKHPFRLMGQTVDMMTSMFSNPKSHNGVEAMGHSALSRGKPESEERGSGMGNDLSGDDIKLVRSYVAFTKPSAEKGRYLRENPDIVDHDMRYLKAHIEVIDRWPKETEDAEDETPHSHRADRRKSAK